MSQVTANVCLGSPCLFSLTLSRLKAAPSLLQPGEIWEGELQLPSPGQAGTLRADGRGTEVAALRWPQGES